MDAKLYVILGSHACRTGMLMLEHKGIEYELVHIPTGLHPIAVRLFGFPGSKQSFRHVDERPHRMLGLIDRLGTVPALRMAGERVQSNREIARFLDKVRPEAPPLFPADPELRRSVEEAERWGDEVLQMVSRRLALAARLHGREALDEDGRLGPLLYRSATVRGIAARAFAQTFAANRESERELLAALPEMLDRVDGWIESGVVGGERLYAADFMIAPSLALLAYRLDARVDLEGRPAMRLLDRLLPTASV